MTESTPPSSSIAKTLSHELWDFIKILIISVVIVVPVRYFVAQPFIVKGASMEPTFQEKNYLVVDELSYYFRGPERGEVAVFRFPLDPSEYFIKRVIGLPGETVKITGGKVYVSKKPVDKGSPMSEPYLPPDLETMGEVTQTLGPDEYFVMGDNRVASLDSRRWGVLPRANITGRVVFRAWPINELGVVSYTAY
ncbi:MAG: signal peptidase I [Candidatus Sungbacteria bacterium]|nr:signal peptidase I [Candidatus Sungbacteria bacterium]